MTAGILALATTSWAQAPTFSRADFATSDAPRGIAAADFNRDGALDLALVNTGRKSVSILMNETGQGRGFVQRHDIVLGGGPFEVVAADVNGDSVADLVVANADLNTIDVVLGKTAGGFEAPQHIAAAGFPRGVAVSDLDWDGRQDIVYTQYDLDRVQILHGDANGQFTARVGPMATGPRPQGIVIGAFVGCCLPDIAVSSTTTRVLSFFSQLGPATFQHSQVVTPSALNVLTTGDFNRDGRPDIAGVSTASNNMVLFRDTGSGFGYYGVFPTGASPRGIEAVDVNRDGHLDLVTANRSASTLTVYLARADSSGWFAAPQTYAAGSGSRDVVAGDFNFDGAADLASANEYADSVSVLTTVVAVPPGPFWEQRRLADGNSPVVEVANFNGNAASDLLLSTGVLLDGATLVPLHSGGSTSRSIMTAGAGDYNGDGRTDVAAIVIFHEGTYPPRIVAELFYGNGTGGFHYAGAFGSFGWVYAIKAADLNRDGRTDLAVANVSWGGSEPRLDLLLAGDGGFAIQPGPTLDAPPLAVDVADLDRNGTPDLVVAAGYYSASAIRLFSGDGAGGFSPGDRLTPPNNVYRVQAVDVNRDAVLDIVGGGDSLYVWLGSSTGSYVAPKVYGNDMYTFVIADLTGDSNPDVLSGSGALLRGSADGTFSAPEPVNVWFQYAAPVDYDRDGRTDLVLVNYYNTMVLFTRAARGPNFAPVALAGPDYTTSYEGQFDDEDCGGLGPSFDPNLDRLTFEWLDKNGQIVDTGEVLCTSPLPSGTHTFTLVARDAHGGESSDSKTITVTPFKESVVFAGSSGWAQGSWTQEPDSTAAEGIRQWHPDAGAAKLSGPLAAPTNTVQVWALVDPTQTYKLWVRMKAQNDSWANDSIFVQFEGGALSGGRTRYAMGTTDALDINLEECSGCGLAGWGWRDERWGASRTSAPVLLRFPTGGYQRIQVQTREDGVSIDQIVLSSEKYLSAPPGPAKRDTTILQPKPW